METIIRYTCPKCGSKQYEIGEMWIYGNFWTKAFQLNSQRFTHITCQHCRYTEIYKIPKKKIAELLNFTSR
jgi:uncharacterized protein